MIKLLIIILIALGIYTLFTYLSRPEIKPIKEIPNIREIKLAEPIIYEGKG